MIGKSRSLPTISQLSKKRIVICLLLPLFLISLVLDIIYLLIFIGNIKERQILLAQFGNTLISDYLNSAKRVLTIAYKDYKNSPRGLFLSTYKALGVQPILTNIFIVTHNNRIIQIFPRYAPGITVYPGIQFFKTEKLTPHNYRLSPPFYSIYSGTIVVAMAAKPSTNDLIIGELNLKLISKINLNQSAGSATTLFITDNKGNFVAHPIIKYVEMQENVGGEPWFKLALRKPQFASVAKHLGNLCIIGCINQADTNWKIVVATRLRSVIGPIIRKSIIIFAFLLLFCTGLVAITQIWISKNIVRPLEEIGKVAKETISDPEKAIQASLLLREKEAPFKELEDFRLSFLEALQHILEQQATIRESEIKFRSLTENAPVGIFIFQNDHFIYTNKMVEVITGYTREELNNIVIWELVHPDHREIPIQLTKIRQSKISPPKNYDSLPIVTKFGEVKWLKLSVGSIEIGGKPAGLGIAVDVTDKHLAEQEKLEYQKKFQYMQRMEAVGILAGGVAHEFNNLLQGFGLNIELLKSKLATSDKNLNDFDYYLDNLEHLKSRASILVESLLTFSKRKKSSKHLISAHKEIECVLSLFAETFPKNITIKSSLQASRDAVFVQEG